MMPALSRVRCPVRIVWGKQDRMIPWKHVMRAPGRAASNLVEDAGHLLQFEIPDDIARILRHQAATSTMFPGSGEGDPGHAEA